MPHTSHFLEFVNVCQPNTILTLEKIYGSALVVDFWEFKAEAAFAIEDSSSFLRIRRLVESKPGSTISEGCLGDNSWYLPGSKTIS